MTRKGGPHVGWRGKSSSPLCHIISWNGEVAPAHLPLRLSTAWTTHSQKGAPSEAGVFKLNPGSPKLLWSCNQGSVGGMGSNVHNNPRLTIQRTTATQNHGPANEHGFCSVAVRGIARESVNKQATSYGVVRWRQSQANESQNRWDIKLSPRISINQRYRLGLEELSSISYIGSISHTASYCLSEPQSPTDPHPTPLRQKIAHGVALNYLKSSLST